MSGYVADVLSSVANAVDARASTRGGKMCVMGGGWAERNSGCSGSSDGSLMMRKALKFKY